MSLLKIYNGQALREMLAEITGPVTVTYRAVETPEVDTLTALHDLMGLTPHLSLALEADEPGEADRVTVRGRQGGAMVFAGAPLGTELVALISAVVVAGRGYSGLSARTRQALVELARPVALQVFTTPT